MPTLRPRPRAGVKVALEGRVVVWNSLKAALVAVEVWGNSHSLGFREERCAG